MILLKSNDLIVRSYIGLRQKVKKLKSKISFSIILVGDNYSSKKYVELKQSRSKQLGINSKLYYFPEDTKEVTIINLITKLNSDPNNYGTLVQLPLPSTINKFNVLNTISPSKDIDGLTATNLGKLYQGEECLESATALAVIKLADYYKIDFAKKHIVIVGSSILIGIPLTAMLINRQATITLCNEFTRNIKAITQTADILITATGKPNLIKSDWIKNDVIIFDAGYELDPITNKPVGDVDFESVKNKCSAITPVPGGVGPITILSLLENVVKSAYN